MIIVSKSQRRLTICNVNADQIRHAIVIPARNENARIGECLRAISQQDKLHLAQTIIVVIVNNSDDQTVKTAFKALSNYGLHGIVIEKFYPPKKGVGFARAIGCNYALSAYPELAALLTTDADCIVQSRWLEKSIALLDNYDAVCGAVDLHPAELDRLPPMFHTYGKLEGTYAALQSQFIQIIDPLSENLSSAHNEIAGASLAINKIAYEQSGGFDPVATGEDRRLVNRMKFNGLNVIHSDDVRVYASCRLQGRAPKGMAEAIYNRVNDRDVDVTSAFYHSQDLFRWAQSGSPSAIDLPYLYNRSFKRSAIRFHIYRMQVAVKNLSKPALDTQSAELA